MSDLRTSFQIAKKTKKEIRDLTAKALEQISRSEDDVSKRLASLFDRAIEPNSYEMAGARARRENGNPPGYSSDPLGDQITWEQLLSRCKKIGVKRLWIAIDDSDYVTKFDKCVFLNPFLHQDLIQACGNGVEVRCFDNVMRAIGDFGKDAGVKAEKLPTEEKAQEIEKELEALPEVALSALSTLRTAGTGALEFRSPPPLALWLTQAGVNKPSE